MHKAFRLVLMIGVFVVAIILNLFGIMRVAPLFITLPLLFGVIYALLNSLFQRNTFRGFK